MLPLKVPVRNTVCGDILTIFPTTPKLFKRLPYPTSRIISNSFCTSIYLHGAAASGAASAGGASFCAGGTSARSKSVRLSRRHPVRPRDARREHRRPSFSQSRIWHDSALPATASGRPADLRRRRPLDAPVRARRARRRVRRRRPAAGHACLALVTTF